MSVPAHRVRCKFTGCDRLAGEAKGWCTGHYSQQLRGMPMRPLDRCGHKGVLWTESEIDRMTALRLAGKTLPEIGEIIGRTTWAVKLKLRSIEPPDDDEGKDAGPRCPRCHMLEPHTCVGGIEAFAAQRRGVEW